MMWRGDDSFIITDEGEKQRVLKRFHPNRVYEVEVKTRRSLRRHNLYWLLLEALAFHFGGGANEYHYELKRKFMRPRIVQGKKGILFELVPSEAFDSCTEDEFGKYFERVQMWLVEQGYTPDEIIRSAN